MYSNNLNGLAFSDMTVCAWINKSSFSEKGIIDKSFNISGVGHGGWGLWTTSSNVLEWWKDPAQDFEDTSGAFIQSNQWTFVAAVWHESDFSVDYYIDGVFTAEVSKSGTSPGPSSDGDLQVGNLQNNLSSGLYAFDGSMYDVAIYDYALTSNDIQTNFLATQFITNIPVPAPDLLYYKMTEASTNTNSLPVLTDSSLHGGTVGIVSTTSRVWTNNVAFPSNSIHFGGVMGHSSLTTTNNSNLFNFTTNLFTINLWVEPNGTGSVNYWMHNQDQYQTNGWYLLFDPTFSVGFGTVSNGTTNGLSTFGIKAVANNGWSMVTIVRNALTNTSIYINGILTTNGNLQSPAPSPNTLTMGISPDGSDIYDGDIWLPQIWSMALSPQQIANLYINQVSGYPWP